LAGGGEAAGQGGTGLAGSDDDGVESLHKGPFGLFYVIFVLQIDDFSPVSCCKTRVSTRYQG
jgi:hypothetical protein